MTPKHGLLLTEACQPYNLWPVASQDAVDIFDIIDRLTDWERRQLIVSYAVRAPASFEHKLLDIWNARQRARQVLNSGSANG